MLFRDCIIAVVVFPMVLAGLGAKAQGNLSSQIEMSIEALADPDPKVRVAAAYDLIRIGPGAELAVPTLVKALAEPDVQRQAANALGRIATSLSDAKAIGALGALREAQTALENHADRGVREHTAPVKRAVEYLELHWWKITTKDVVDWIGKHPYIASIIGAVSIWLALCFGLFFLALSLF